MVKANRLELDHGLTGVAPYVRPVHNGTFMWGGGGEGGIWLLLCMNSLKNILAVHDFLPFWVLADT
jgi:hypothetical protein